MEFLKIKALKVKQPLADFYISKIKASDLLRISFSEELQYTENGKQKGSQRPTDSSRLKEIAKYIDSVEMSFPSSIILAVNYNEDGEIEDDTMNRWDLKKLSEDIYEIVIPTSKKLAAIIDGQHRLKAFNFITVEGRKDIDIPCAIFFDLPNSYQAFLFATINGNQKNVPKSLALEQFGFNVEDEPKNSWTPEKMAVYFSRKLNLSKDRKSVFYNRIKIAPKYDSYALFGESGSNWIVSTATIVDGVLSLISSNPKRDRVEMGQKHIFKGRTRKLLSDIRDNSPLRDFFINLQDDLIFDVIFNYFKIVEELLWREAKSESYIFKTVGIQALFDLLKKIVAIESDLLEINFNQYLSFFKDVDFSDNYFQASGVGRSRIKKVLFVPNNIAIKLNAEDLVSLKRILDYDMKT